MSTCIVRSCTSEADTRKLCARHLAMYRRKGQVRQELPTENEPLVCICRRPHPDAIGQCFRCGRLVVTYAHANRDRYRETYPTEWHRALRLGLVPKGRRTA